MEGWGNQNFSNCQLGDRRLNKRALKIGQALGERFGSPLSIVFPEEKFLKRAYEFFANPQSQFNKITQPHHEKISLEAMKMPVVLAVGDTTYLDYKKIKAKRDGYGHIGNGGNGLILHTTLAVEPIQGQPLGLLWQKLWHREPKAPVPKKETSQQKKERLALQKKQNREKPYEDKESYKWVEAIESVETQINLLNKSDEKTSIEKASINFTESEEIRQGHPRSIHIFDREGDIAEVFNRVRQMPQTGVVVRAAHNRCLEPENDHLWEYVMTQAIQSYQEVDLPATAKRTARKALLSVRFGPVKLRCPKRFKNSEPLLVYAVYAREIDPPDGEEAVDWMLLTTEPVTNNLEAATILRWYTYRWHIEEYHKILKSGCQVESYRLAATSMQALLGFLTIIAVELLRVTYLHRTQPNAPALDFVSCQN